MVFADLDSYGILGSSCTLLLVHVNPFESRNFQVYQRQREFKIQASISRKQASSYSLVVVCISIRWWCTDMPILCNTDSKNKLGFDDPRCPIVGVPAHIRSKEVVAPETSKGSSAKSIVFNEFM